MDTSIESADAAHYYAEKEVSKLDMVKEKRDVSKRVYEHKFDRKEAADCLGTSKRKSQTIGKMR